MSKIIKLLVQINCYKIYQIKLLKKENINEDLFLNKFISLQNKEYIYHQKLKEFSIDKNILINQVLINLYLFQENLVLEHLEHKKNIYYDQFIISKLKSILPSNF